MCQVRQVPKMDHHHHHDHPQVHLSGHSHSYTDANKAYFNDSAQAWDARPGAEELARRLVGAITRLYPDLFDEEKTEVMDFACGTGMISRALCPSVKSILGVDISDRMVEQYNVRASNQGLLPEEMKAVCQDLRGTDEELGGARFDVIVCASSYHHFSSIEDVTKILAYFLKPGGTLVVADIMKDADGSYLFPESTHHIVAHHHGLTEADMRWAFGSAGLVDFTFSPAIVPGKMHGKAVSFFLCRGTRNWMKRC